MKNKPLTILLPLLLATTFAVGMLVNSFLTQRNGIKLPPRQSKYDVIMRLISDEYVEDVNIDSLTEELLPSLFEKLDPHSFYISADEYRDMIDPIMGSFEGIGVQFNIQNDTVVVVQVIHGGPSEKLNILAGDRIVTVNDSVIAGNGITNEKTVKLLKGPRGTKVKVGIRRVGVKDLIPFEITRDAVPITSVDAAYLIDDSTGYVAINCFSQNTIDEFLSAVSKLNTKSQNMKNIIVDLRDNGGGLLLAVIHLANEFLQAGDTIVYTQGKNTLPEYYVAEGDGSCEKLNLVVLINEFSASASEIFAGAMQDNGRGTIVGRRSYGKGVVNEDFPLSDSSVVRLSIKKFYTPSGRCIQKPYNGSLSDYNQELLDRYAHGELNSADSVNFPDSLKFVTKTGKIVYGGGGIMPDVFVPIDSTSYSPSYQKIMNSGFVYEYSFAFTEKHRAALQAMEFHDAYKWLSEKITMQGIVQYAESHSKTSLLLDKNASLSEQQRVEMLARCYVIRNVFGDSAFFEMYNAEDEIINKALDVFQNKR